MVDNRSSKISDDEGLEKLLLFCILTADSKSSGTAAALEKIIKFARDELYRLPPRVVYDGRAVSQLDPRDLFDVLWPQTQESLYQLLQVMGVSRWKTKAAAIYSVVHKLKPNLLHTCSIAQLNALPGIGPKTAKYFVSLALQH